MKKSKLPKTDSIQKLAAFWDTHDLTDFEDQIEEVTELIFVRDRGETYIVRSPRLANREQAGDFRKQIVDPPL